MTNVLVIGNKCVVIPLNSKIEQFSYGCLLTTFSQNITNPTENKKLKVSHKSEINFFTLNFLLIFCFTALRCHDSSTVKTRIKEQVD